MLTVITLDFETYYSKKKKYSLSAKDMTIEKYIRSDGFEVIGLAVKVGKRPTEFLAPHEIEDWLKHIEIAYGWENVRLVAQNGRFDFAILGWKYGVYPQSLCDTMLMSRALQLWDSHSLDSITRNLRDRFGWVSYYSQDGDLACAYATGEDEFLLEFAIDKGTEVHDADGKHLMDFTDEEYDAYAEYCKTDVDLTYSAYCFFKHEMSYPEAEITAMTITLEMFTYPVMELDLKVLAEVKRDVDEHRQASLDRAGITLTEVRSDSTFAEALRRLGVEPPTKLNKKGEVKYAFAKGDLDFLKLLEHENEDVVDLVQSRLDNKSSQVVTRVQNYIDTAQRGKLASPIEYYAARTGRAGGADKLNVQNMNRNKLVSSATPYGKLVFYEGKADRFIELGEGNKVYLARRGWVSNDEDLLHEVGLRDSIKAPPGKVLVVNDLSQVEARNLPWLAGEQWVLDAFVAKQDIYKATASRSFGVPYEEITKSQRFVGKSQVLGLGYQAGIAGLKKVLGKKSEEFSDEELQSWVNSYRASVPNIRRFWKTCENALKAMVSGTQVAIDVHGLFYTDGCSIVSPSGLRLQYPKMHIRKGERGYDEYWFWGRDATTKKPAWEKTFGGKIAENLTQHIAGYQLKYQMGLIVNKFRERGWSRDDAHLAMQVHDEVVCCCRSEIAEEVLEIMQYCMKQVPPFCKGLPLGSDGDIATRYGCAK